MPITFTWIDDSSIVSFDLSGSITSQDFDTLGRLGLDIIQQHPQHSLYVFVDMFGVVSFPRNLVNTALRSQLFVAFVNHHSVQGFAFCGVNATSRFMIETVIRNIPVKIVNDRDTGIGFLRDQRDDLPANKYGD